MIKEACVESLAEAILAEKNGADRIELCSHLELDGLTPSYELMKEVCSKLTIPVMVMARPRGGSFVFTKAEVEQTKRDIDLAKKTGVRGVVIGLLTATKEIDMINTSLLAEYAYPLEVTFHKAFDETSDLIKAFGVLSKIKGITRILTSGGETTAMGGKETLKKLVDISNGKLKIIVAGKVTKNNILQVQEASGASEFHGKLIVGDLH